MAQGQTAPDRLSGTVERVALADLMQMICLAQMSHAIVVQHESGTGAIFVRSGQVCHAVLGGAQGEEPLFEMLRWRSGKFDAAPSQSSDTPATITRGWEYLLIEAMRSRLTGEEAAGESAGPVLSAGFAGRLGGVQLSDLVQLACMSRTDHVFEVKTEPRTGRIYARSGQVYHSECGKLQGEDAFCELLLAETGEFRTVSLEGEPPETIAKPWEYLLMDAMRYRDEKTGGAGEELEEEIQSLLTKLHRMKVSEKIRAAMVGDKEVRSLLIREPNKLVQIAIINNPRITEGEVSAIASSRNVDEEVLRRIANTREWMKIYAVRLALTTNPKCPLPSALRLLQGLTQQDIRQIAKSKSVPIGLAQTARRLIHEP